MSIAVDVIDAANRLAATAPHDGATPLPLRVLTPGGGDVALRGGLRMPAHDLLHVRPSRWIVLAGLGAAAPGEIAARLERDDIAATTPWLRDALASGAQVAASCTGVFVVGEAGGLERRRCTTTWWLAGSLARRYRTAVVRPDEVVVRDGAVRTAGAAFAHADLMLHVVEAMTGPDVADAVARRLLISRRRSQAPFRHHSAEATTDPTVTAVESFATANLDRPLPLAELARVAHVSPRTLARRFQEELAVSPARYVQRLRVEAALNLISSTDLGLAQVADKVGFADAATLSRAVRRATGQPPGSFRDQRAW